MDRAADRILRAELDLPYRRYLVLYGVDQLDVVTQRALADWLGVTEPSVSRMTRTMVEAGLIEADPDPAGGNRRILILTKHGRAALKKGGSLLEDRLADLVDSAGVSYNDYCDATMRLLAALSGDAPSAASSPLKRRTRLRGSSQ
jgi:DNA-binding MarR family transcriptional regulator